MGTPYGQFKQQSSGKKKDALQQIVDGMCDVAAGKVGFGDFSPILPVPTLWVARDLARGAVDVKGGIVEGILGDDA